MPDPSEPRPDSEDREEAPAEQQSVLSHISELIGSEPKVLLREDDSDDGVLSLGTDEARERPFLSQRFQILGEVARGGVGVVLKGHDLDLGRNVAVKVLRKNHLDNPVMVARFVEEAQIGGQLQHPGIVPVYELGQQEDRRPYFAMKLVKGRTLGRLLSERKDRREDRSRFLSIFHQVCQTMAYAHSRGVIHRDLKPANVMVGAFGEVQVVDWGLAKVLKEGGVADEGRERSLQQSQMSVIETIRNRPGSSGSDSIAGSVMGTPAYMPPEQAMGHVEKLDERSDVFALGAILCEVLSGEGPYVGSPEDVYVMAAHARLDDAFARLDEVQVDQELIQLCKDCLSPAPPARPRDAGEVARRLGAHLAAVEERAHEAEIAAAESRVRAVNERKARRMTLALAAAVVIAGSLGATSYVIFQHQEQQRVRDAENAVSSACEDVRQLLGEARNADVGDYSLLEAAGLQVQNAVQLAADPDVGPESRERVQGLVAALATQRSRAEEVAAEEARNTAMIQRLEVLRDQSHDFGWDELADGDRGANSFAAAFQDFGLDILEADLDEACAWIGEQAIAEELAFALDDWVRFLRAEGVEVARPWQELVIMAQAADPDDLRNEIRDAILEEDAEALLELAGSPDLVEVPAPTLVFLAESLLESGQQSPAIALLRQAHALYPADFSVNSRLAWRLEDQDAVAATRHYAAALAARPDNTVARANLGYTLMLEQEFDDARTLLTEGLRQRPGERTLTMALAYVEVAAGNADRALELIRQPSQGGSMVHEFLRLQGLIRYHQGRFEEAVSVMARTLEATGPTRTEGVRRFEREYAMALYQAGRGEEAKALLARAPDNWHTWAESILEYLDGNHEDSTRLFGFVRASFARGCENPLAQAGVHRSLAWVLTTHPDPALREPELALVHAQRAVELSPRHPHCWMIMAAARFRNGDWLGVLDATERARRAGLEPAWDQLDYLSAGAAWHLGDAEDAKEWYRKGQGNASRVNNALFWPTQITLRREFAQLLELD